MQGFKSAKSAALLQLASFVVFEPVAMRMTWTALPITSAGRRSPLGPRGICDLEDGGGRVFAVNCIVWLAHPVHQHQSKVSLQSVARALSRW